MQNTDRNPGGTSYSESASEDVDDARDVVHQWELKRKNLTSGIGHGHEIDEVRFMIQSLCEHPLLSRQQEQSLGKVIQDARAAFVSCLKEFPCVSDSECISDDGFDAASVFGRYKLLKKRLHDLPESEDAESVLGEPVSCATDRFDVLKNLYKEFDRNRSFFVEHNQRLVVAVAKRFRNLGLPLVDLISYGNAGLLTAVDKYEHERGNKFSTYATHWIKQSIRKALSDTSRLIRIPVHMLELAYRMRKAEIQYRHDHGAKPSVAKLAELLGVPKDDILLLKSSLQSTQSMDALLKPNSDGDATLYEKIGEDGSESESLNQADVTSVMRAAIQRLHATKGIEDFEIQALRWLHGLEDGHSHPIKDVALILGKTKERVKQANQKLLRILQRDPQLQKLGVPDNVE